MSSNTEYSENQMTAVTEALAAQDWDLAERIAKATKDVGMSFLAGAMYTEIATAKADFEANDSNDITHAAGIEL